MTVVMTAEEIWGGPFQLYSPDGFVRAVLINDIHSNRQGA